MVTTVVGSSDAKLIEKWDNKLKDCQQARINYERQWCENLAFFSGRQWIVSTKSTNGGFSLVEQPAQDNWRVRHTANRILRIIRTEVTKLSKEEPQFYCVPASTDESDRLAAMAGDAIAEFLMRTKYFNRKRLEATFWTTICGTGYLKNYYDEAKIEIDGQPGKIDFEAVTAFHLFVPNLQATDIQDQPFVIHARTMTPEAVFESYGKEIEPGTAASSIIDARFLSAVGIKESQKSQNKQCYVKEVYIKKCKDYPNGAMIVYGENTILYVYEAPDPMAMLGTDSAMPPPTLFDDMPLADMPPAGMPSGPVGNMPSPASPMGANPIEAMMGMLKGAVGSSSSQEEPVGNIEAPKSVYDGGQDYQHEFPYTHGRYPFAKIDHIPTGMFYGDSVIKSLISPQKEYNRTRSIMLENRNLAGKPQWAYTAGAFDPKKFNSRPGLLLAINMGFDPPMPLAQPELPPSVSNELEVTLKDMDDISSQYEITKGRTPPGVEAASAIAYLSEENDTILYHTVQSLENAVQETGIQVLANVHDFWPIDRIVRMTSKNQFAEVKQFKSTDLKPIMDFRVETGSMAPRSVAAKQAFITELMKMGAIEPNKALQYLQMSETDKLYDELMIDNRHAQRENVYMAEGQPLYKIDPEGQPPMDPMTGMPQMDPMTGMPVPAYKTDVVRDPMTGEPEIGEDGQPLTYQVSTNPFDAHDIHVQEHEKYQKSQEYELLDPQIQAIIQEHVDQHKMELLKERNASQADDMMKPGTEESASPRQYSDQPQPSPNGQGAPVSV
jgi:hypothetical protein